MEARKYIPHPYQVTATAWIEDKPRCALFLDMGLGKTVATLTAVKNLIDAAEVSQVLVIAPKTVTEATWATECEKWQHLRGLSVVKIVGDRKRRTEAVATPADIHVIGRDNLVWLLDMCKGTLPYDMVILDELTSFKSPRSSRFKAFRSVAAAIPRIVGLTGTPAPNGLADLWAQIYCIDQGARLGRFVTKYREAYFDERKWNNIVVKCTPKKGAVEQINAKINDICLAMQAKDYLTLPERLDLIEEVSLPPAVRKQYDDLARDLILNYNAEHPEGAIVANSAAALLNKLQQVANGAVYDTEQAVTVMHDEKLAKLAELVEGVTDGGVLVFYSFRSDVPRIVEALKGLRVEEYVGEASLRDWNEGKIDVLLCHPASTAYGLNMQQGGHYVVWFGLTWNLELYQQANARLHRQGQEKPVVVYHIVAADTVEQRMLSALTAKQGQQQAMIDSLKELTERYGREQ